MKREGAGGYRVYDIDISYQSKYLEAQISAGVIYLSICWSAISYIINQSISISKEGEIKKVVFSQVRIGKTYGRLCLRGANEETRPAEGGRKRSAGGGGGVGKGREREEGGRRGGRRGRVCCVVVSYSQE